jgi:hypothetical protein
MTYADPSTSILMSPIKAARAVTPALRDPRLDFFRGVAMFIILLAHTPGDVWTNWIPVRWGFSDATEVFVFCSGMASAIAFGRTFDRAGWRLGTARVGFRVWQVYWAHLGMFFLIATMLAAIDQTGAFGTVYIGTLNLWTFFAEPGPQLVGLFTLTYVPNYFDILPMYMVVLALIPVVMALSRVSLWRTAAFVIGLWLLAQSRVLAWFGLEGLYLNLPAEPWSDRQWYFNPFAWQLVFFTGFGLMRGWIPAPPVRGWMLVVAAVIVVVNVPLSSIGVHALDLDWARAWRSTNEALIDKSDFGILRYVHFLALAYLAWAAVGAGGARLKALGQAGPVGSGLVTVVMKVGQQGLAVFVVSMVLARFNGFLLDEVGRTVLTCAAVNLSGFAILIGCAYGAGWFKSQPWRGAVK